MVRHGIPGVLDRRFFFVLWFKQRVLYAPKDYRSDETSVALIANRTIGDLNKKRGTPVLPDEEELVRDAVALSVATYDGVVPPAPLVGARTIPTPAVIGEVMTGKKP